MADIRINSLPSTATSFNTDDYIAIDGASAGTRKMLAANPPFTDVTLGASGPSVKSTLSARAPRQGLVFDGTAGADVASVPAFGTGDFTFAAWVKQSSLAAAYLCSASAAPDSAFLYLVGDGTFQWWSNTAARATSSAGAIVANKWILLTATRTGGTTTLYANGVSVGSGADSQNLASAINRIGQRAGGTAILNGALIPLIYNRALSAAEVVALYEAGAPSGADYGAIGGNATNSSIVTGADSNFSSDTGNWAVALGSKTISGGTLQLTDGSSVYYAPATAIIPVGKKVRFTVTVSSITGGNARYYNGSSYVNFASSAGTYTVEFTALAATRFYLSVAGGNAVFDDYTAFWLGLLLAPDAAQAGGGLVWYDTSGNAANITLPASGVSWNVPSSQKTATGWTFGATNTTEISNPTAQIIRQQFTASTVGLRLESDSGNGHSVVGTTSNHPCLLYSNAIERARIFANGNFGIGTGSTDGGQKLQVSGTARVSGVTTVGGGSNDLLKLEADTAGNGGYLMGRNAADTDYTPLILIGNGLTLKYRNGANSSANALAIDSSANATFAKSVTVNSPSGTSSGLLVKAFNSTGGNVQQWADFQTSSGLTLARFLRGNGAAGYDSNGLSIDSYEGLRVNLNALGGSGGVFTISGGALRLGNAYTAGAPTATGYVTIQDSAGNTYKVLVGT